MGTNAEINEFGKNFILRQSISKGQIGADLVYGRSGRTLRRTLSMCVIGNWGSATPDKHSLSFQHFFLFIEIQLERRGFFHILSQRTLAVVEKKVLSLDHKWLQKLRAAFGLDTMQSLFEFFIRLNQQIRCHKHFLSLNLGIRVHLASVFIKVTGKLQMHGLHT
ncbi:hypothetical protein METSCH_B07490 [Metschnikowia aff. pulcherrima]|uniref:Uncharacterized protein n=1 Tax=Metschnikowia aff. pulcherrima TaxID=2163413 RepID=A0A4V1AE06_9ASCO|nr:hypothetical protein METSCH_B07490 [Metschnikowia aff. pulcherrima]